MRRLRVGLLAALLLLAGATSLRSSMQGRAATHHDRSSVASELHDARQTPLDLEIGGDLDGVPPDATRYISREDLLTLPQVSYTVSDDPNFIGPTKISGVSLATLIGALGAAQADMAVAICDDKYRANYPRDYMTAHQPVLVLTINGRPPALWPKDSEGHGNDMGPYMISHPSFTPSFKIFSHADEAQIPWGVVRIEFRKERAVFGAILPRGPRDSAPLVVAGYRIAQQNCFRCHNMGREGGQKSGVSWPVLSARAASSPDSFAAYVRDPTSKNPHAQMPGNPGYDSKTMSALIAYFRTFSVNPPQGNP